MITGKRITIGGNRTNYWDLSKFGIYVDGKKVKGNCPHCYNTGKKININSWKDIFTLSLRDLKDLILQTKCDVCHGEGLIYEDNEHINKHTC